MKTSLFQDGDSWYFWDETWTQFPGPYESESQAKQTSDDYFSVYLETGIYTDILQNKRLA